MSEIKTSRIPVKCVKIKYLRDFQQCYKRETTKGDDFTVILGNTNKPKKKNRSIIDAARPLIYFSSLFGIQTIGNPNQNTFKVKLLNRVYAVILISVIILLDIFVRPAYWNVTLKDTPLKILIISQGIQETLEIVFFIFITSFRNSDDYVKLYKIFNDFDDHFNMSKQMFRRRQLVALALIAVPVIELLLTFCFLDLSFHHLIAHFIFLLLALQGAICAFFLMNVHSCIIIFKDLLLTKSQNINIAKHITFGTKKKSLIKTLLIGDTHKRRLKNICWFELMQMYDQIADIMYIFNKIYSEQILVMFNSWFMTTLLAICRILSPTVQHTDTIISELMMYLMINCRPIILTKISESFIVERRKINLIVLHTKVYMTKGYIYKDQLELMIDLVKTRKIEISSRIYPINISTMFHFAGRVISYAVLMIQYFYLYIHEIEQNILITSPGA